VRVSLGVGFERFDGELTIEAGVVRFDGPLTLGPPFVLTRYGLGIGSIGWDPTLGGHPPTNDPIVLRTTVRRRREAAPNHRAGWCGFRAAEPKRRSIGRPVAPCHDLGRSS
jgi:hypothetical protein